MPNVILSRRAKIALSVVAILIVLLILVVKLSSTYIDLLWFREVGAAGVFSTVFWTRIVLFAIFGVLMAAIIAGNLAIAYITRPPFRPLSPEQQNLQNYVQMVEPRRRLIVAGVAIITFLAAGASAQGDWAAWQTWLHGVNFGTKDPQFHLDVSFYAWDLPVYRLMLGFGFTAVIFSIILVVGTQYLTGAIRLQTPGPKMTLAARRHLTILIFVFMALKAVAYWLDRYSLVFSERSGRFTGASYTDVHSALPAKTILFWIAIVLAIGVIASLWLRSALLPGIGFIVLIVLSILMGGIYPAIVQQVSVSPNASTKEAPYIGRNIKATRVGYGVETATATSSGSVSYKQYAATSTPAASAVNDRDTTVDNIRILDPNIISPTFVNTQKIARPYGFSSKLDVDRYTIDGVEHDYIVAVREQVPGANLKGSENNWINQHTVYTHGYGFVAAEADRDVTSGDTSDYTEGDIPPVGPLNVTVPQAYYGQLLKDYSIVGAKGSEREYDANGAKTTYKGKGGISLSSPITKLAFALHEKETNFILNDAVGADGARIIINRDPKQRVEKMAPFLTADGDPYPIVDQRTGHMVWMVDAYTTMANYPYSERQSLAKIAGTSLQQGQSDTQINYIRNSVKATVDAYDGTVNLYAWDSSDPVLKTWRSVFPNLIKPASKMPADIREHVRYPQDLFNVQRSLLTQYHISDPVKSYNGNGRWQVPSDPFAPNSGDQPAYYVLANPPTGGSAGDAQFQLTTPLTVNSASNLAAFMTVDSDPGPNYGRITVLEVPGKSNIQGPSQIANVFKSEGVISRDINLLDSGQTRVLHGNLLTLPLGNSFLYVEPLYVQSTDSNSYPTLQRVLVTYGNQKGYAATLDGALDDLRDGGSLGASITAGQTSNTPTSSSSGSSTGTSPSGTPSSTTPSSSPSQTSPAPTTTPTTTAPAGTVDGLLTQLDTAENQLKDAYASADQDKIAQAQAKVNKLVAQLLAARSSGR